MIALHGAQLLSSATEQRFELPEDVFLTLGELDPDGAVKQLARGSARMTLKTE